MNTKTPCIAVIGSGYWGKNLVRNYHQLGALRLICDKDETVLDRFRREYPSVDTCMALQDVLSRDDINGVVLATPAETHFYLGREVLLARKHLYVEKPLVLDENEAEELIDLAGQSGVKLMVGHLLQYHPAFVRLKQLAARGDLGRINYIYSHRLNLGKIRREENILWSFAPHDISMILAIAGEFPESVLATGGNYLHRKIADVTTTHLEFPSGMRAHIFVSWLHPFKVQQLIVVGESKMAVFDDTKPWPEKLLTYPHEIRWQNNVPVPEKADPERIEIPEIEPLRLECEHFLQCIVDSCPPTTDGMEGLRVLRVLKAGQRSLDQQGAKIFLEQSGAMSGIALSAPRPGPRTRAPVPDKPPAMDNSASFFVHPTAVIDNGSEIGAGTKIWHFSHVLTNSRVGEKCNIGQNVVIGPDVTIGKRCKIQNNVSVFKGVTLEDGVFCGPSMVFTNIYNPRAEIGKMDQVRPTLVRHGATLGANCTIMCGHTIGRYAFVGAGAVVTHDVPDYALVVGNPARQVGWMSRAGERLDLPLHGNAESVCPGTGEHYRLSDGILRQVD
jgi:UDP-2-acetamido-3-amino-2,3-dideoxy-glucuronate N-acetyltransferase